jgi:hypothetical protein
MDDKSTAYYEAGHAVVAITDGLSYCVLVEPGRRENCLRFDSQFERQADGLTAKTVYAGGNRPTKLQRFTAPRTPEYSLIQTSEGWGFKSLCARQ